MTDAFNDGHGFRLPPRMPRPEKPMGLETVKGRISVVSAGLDGYKVETFPNNYGGGCASTKVFYDLIQNRRILFVALYGADGHAVNNYYRTAQDARR